MKRLISFILITVMMLGILAGCETAPKQVEEHTFPDDEYAVNATDMAVVGDKIYYISGEKVYETVSDTVVFEKFPAEFISSNGTELAIYGNGQVWCGEKTYTIPQSEINSFVYADGTFCWSYQNDDLPQIGFYNIKTGETISVSPLTGVECKVMRYQGAKILVLCYEISGTTYLYDFDTGVMKPGLFAEEANTHFAAYHAADHTLLYFDLASVYMNKIHMDTNEAQRFTPTAKISSDVVKFLFSGESGIFLKQDGTLHVITDYAEPVDENLIVKILRVKSNDIVNFTEADHRFEKMTDALKNEYGIILEFQYVVDKDKIIQKLLAGDSDFDIFFGTSDSLHPYYPIYAPLESYECIMEQFDLMLDEVRGICTYNGHIFGVLNGGIDVNSSVLGCNDDVFEELGLDYPEENWTYQDYYDLAVKAYEKGALIYNYQICMPGDYLARFGDAYNTKLLTDDGTIIREVLYISKELQTMKNSLNDENAVVLFEPGNWQFLNSQKPHISKPSFDDIPHVIATAAYVHMNAASQNKENAAKVIAEYMKVEYGDNPNSGGILFKETAEKISRRSETDAANMELYKKRLQDFKPYYIDWDLMSFINDQWMLYLNDEQDLEYTADQIYARAKMIFEE